MFLIKLINKIKATQEYIICSCNSMGEDTSINIPNILELCAFIDKSIETINQAESLSDIKKGLEHAIYLLDQIKDNASKCSDTNNKYALRIYRATNLSSPTRAEVNNFIG
jgi:hypothetical protein